jgi:serine/threonine protein kinase
MSDEAYAQAVPLDDDDGQEPVMAAAIVEETEPAVAAPVHDSGFPTLEQLAALLPQYEFHAVLGVGGMGAVYRARQAALDRWVAIKLMPQSASLNPDDAQRFIKEARSMAKLSHPGIAAVYDFGQTMMGHLYLVMELVDGEELQTLITRGDLTPERIRELVPQICEALQFAHDHGVVHRDIKPGNILITRGWRAKIVDFGLSGDGAVYAEDLQFGTPEYVAPERMVQGAVVDHRADIYALGVVIHEMFTKTTPLAAGSSAYQGMPESFGSVVARCTAPDPAKRFQRVSEILSFLAVADSGKKTTTQAAAPPLHLQPQLRKPKNEPVIDKANPAESRQWLWATIVVVIACAGYWLWSQQREKDRQSAFQASVLAEKARREAEKAEKAELAEKLAKEAAEKAKAEKAAEAAKAATKAPEPPTPPAPPKATPPAPKPVASKPTPKPAAPKKPLPAAILPPPDISNLAKDDPELAALRDAVPAVPDGFVSDDQFMAAVRDLTTKYGAALKRAAAAVPPPVQAAMNAEADAIAQGFGVPAPATDATTQGEHQRLRGIYRTQVGQLDTKRRTGLKAALQTLEPGVKALAQKRRAAKDDVGAARCDALLFSYSNPRTVAEVLAKAFKAAP